MRVRIKPGYVDAYLHHGDAMDALEWSGEVNANDDTQIIFKLGSGLFIRSALGDQYVPIGHYIICGWDKRLYSTTAERFKEHFEIVETMQAQCWICPKCYDDHFQGAPCTKNCKHGCSKKACRICFYL